MRKLLIPLVLLTGCTSQQIEAWKDWYSKDPQAATQFASSPEIQAQLSPRPVANKNLAIWDRIAYCESGGRWDYPITHNSSGSYSGGLMIWTKAWSAYGGLEYAPNAYQATKAQQIDIAERIRADQGWGAWDCY